jgi:transcriptional regulator with XRE-family HTH domain
VSIEFGKWLKTELVARGMKQRDLARFCGTTDNRVSNWIVGMHKPSADAQGLIAKALKLKVSDVRGKL